MTPDGEQFADTAGRSPAEFARLAARFASHLGAEAVLTGAACAHFAVDGQIPSLVVRPQTPTQVAEALALASEEQLAVAPWGGGTQMVTGYPLRRCDVVLSLADLTAIEIGDPADHLVTAQAGCTIADLNAALAPHGQFVALDGPLAERATLGGRLATGSLGLRRGHYGNPRDLIVNLVIARSDGVLMHTGGVANRHMLQHTLGYDLNKLFVGSLGTLGIIVAATVSTADLPTDEATVLAAFNDSADLWELCEDLAAAELHPAALVICGAGTLAAERGLSAAQAEALQPAAHPLLLIRLIGPWHELQRQALTVRSLALKYGAAIPLLVHGPTMVEPWTVLDDLPATVDLLPTEAVIKVAVLASEIGTVVEMARALCAEHGLLFCWLADVATGVVWLRVTSTEDAPAAEQAPPFTAALVGLQTALARRWRNAMVLGCAPALRHLLPLWGADPQGIDLLRIIKQRFDPENILNPGRFERQ